MFIRIDKIIYHSRVTAKPIKAVTWLFKKIQCEIIMIKISKLVAILLNRTMLLTKELYCQQWFHM